MKRLLESVQKYKGNLYEGVFEMETTNLSRDIIVRLKNKIRSGELFQMPYMFLEPKVPEGLGEVDYIAVKVIPLRDQSRVPHARRQKKAVNMRGQYSSRNKNLIILMSINIEDYTAETLIQSIGSWLPELKSLLRHEIEHSNQKAKGNAGKEKYSGSHLGKGIDKTRKEALEYLQSQEEMEAYVVGLYKSAKTKRIPFVEEFDNWMTGMRFSVLMLTQDANKISDDEVRSAFENIEKQYIDYAAKRFPNQQINEGWKDWAVAGALGLATTFGGMQTGQAAEPEKQETVRADDSLESMTKQEAAAIMGFMYSYAQKNPKDNGFMLSGAVVLQNQDFTALTKSDGKAIKLLKHLLKELRAEEFKIETFAKIGVRVSVVRSKEYTKTRTSQGGTSRTKTSIDWEIK
jgi:hypothetical protein